ncbi:hypothetical protein ACRQ4B_05195 [Curtobacterium sp. SP.BCo]|uniref:hypothetical protein n=1 Tax=Curtobacterium sp. SP.BCo TaxID=3435229 RepID=UPI003F7390E3
MITVLGAVLVVVLGVTVVLRRDWAPTVIGTAAALPYSVGAVVGGNGVPLFHIAGAAAVLLLARTSPLRTTHWTANVLVLFALWGATITALGPWLFRGIPVLSSRGGLDGQVLDPDRLAYTISTAAQLGYLVIALLTVLFLVRVGGAGRAVRVALAVGTALSTLRGLSVRIGTGAFEWLFDTNPTIPYSRIGPEERLRGVFSEPSELAAFSVPAAVYFAVAAGRSSGRTRVGWTALLLCACTNLLQASSGVALVASVVVGVTGLVVLAVRSALRGGAGTPWFVIGGLVVAIAVLAAGPALWTPAVELVDDKVGSQSWNARTGGDDFSWGVAADTLWLGTGLGGNRPSSFAMSVLSCLGVPGLLLLTLVLVGAVVAAFRTGRTPYGCALLALLVAKSVGTPDLSTPILWLLLAACVTEAWRAHRVAPVGRGGPDRGHDGLEARLGPAASVA